ncbi:hypothetical protein [Streptomyces sp. NPDC003077]|uniref:hypothetical protein n=1 Tax=Streptomyces sp. NPDC003077 TaxID=3154443 RepID=UPI0033A199B0
MTANTQVDHGGTRPPEAEGRRVVRRPERCDRDAPYAYDDPPEDAATTPSVRRDRAEPAAASS